MGGVPDAPRIKFCGITRLEDAQRAVDAGRLGARADLLAAVRAGLRRRRGAAHRARAAPPGRDRRRLRQRDARRGRGARRGGAALDRPAARRRGPALLRRGRPPHRREGHQGRAPSARRGRRRASTAFHTDFHLLDAHRRVCAGGTGETFDWRMLAQRAAREVPLILVRRPDAGERRRGDRRHAPVGRRCRQRHRGGPGVKDPEQVEPSPRRCSDDGGAAVTA